MNVEMNQIELKRNKKVFNLAIVLLILAFVTLFIFEFPSTFFSFAIIMLSLVVSTKTYANIKDVEAVMGFENEIEKLFCSENIYKNVYFDNKDATEKLYIPYLIISDIGNYAMDIFLEKGIIYKGDDKRTLNIDRKGNMNIKKYIKRDNPNFLLTQNAIALEKKVQIEKGEKIKVNPVTVFVSKSQVLRIEDKKFIKIDNLNTLVDGKNEKTVENGMKTEELKIVIESMDKIQ